MRHRLYTTSVKAWDAMLEAISRAKKTIYIEMYIFEDDTRESHDFIGMLKKKAKEGVQVVIVADAYGSGNLKAEVAGSLKKHGIEFLFFSHWLRHIHRKILIIDDKVAFIGGVNIGKKFKNWNDLQIKVGGKIVQRMSKSFSYTYKMSGGKNEKIIKLQKKKLSYKFKNWFIDHWPTKNIHTLRSHYVEKISGAKNKIQIITPYFTPPRWLISLLDSASRRGVIIEVIIPSKSDHPLFVDRINLYFIYKLHQLGINFYLGKKMNHAKLLIIDGKEGILGSQNIDPFSFQINMEAGIFFQEKKIIKELSSIFGEWKNKAEKFNPKKYQMHLVDYIVFILVKIFNPIL